MKEHFHDCFLGEKINPFYIHRCFGGEKFFFSRPFSGGKKVCFFITVFLGNNK